MEKLWHNCHTWQIHVHCYYCNNLLTVSSYCRTRIECDLRAWFITNLQVYFSNQGTQLKKHVLVPCWIAKLSFELSILKVEQFETRKKDFILKLFPFASSLPRDHWKTFKKFQNFGVEIARDNIAIYLMDAFNIQKHRMYFQQILSFYSILYV